MTRGPSILETKFRQKFPMSSFKRFSNHYHPDKTTRYFISDPEDEIVLDRESGWRCCTVLFPFFNEEAYELERSLESIQEQAETLVKSKVHLHILCVMDGWYKSSDSMKEYVKDMFPYPYFWDEILKKDNIEIETFVLQSGAFQSENVKISLMIKKDNRRKHNSHMWFFNAFCREIQPEYCFATDCGTLFEKGCLKYLIQCLDENERYSGCTGRQRLMSKEQQGCYYENGLASFYRLAQAFDYESSITTNLGAFALNGFLPVLPGPCGLYRFNDIQGEPLDYYFSIVNANPIDSGLCIANMMLAEDRVLSLSAVLKTGKRTTWVPQSVFYSEAETSSEKFISQRRRWTNGTLAGILYLLFYEPSLVTTSRHTFWYKFTVFFLTFIQLMIYIVIILSPSIYAFTVYYIMRMLTIKYIAPLHTSLDPEWVGIVYLSILLLYFVFTLVHHIKKWCPFIYFFVCIFNGCCSLLILGSMIGYMVNGVIEHGVSSLYELHQSLIITIAFLMMTTPFILSLMTSFISFYNMCKTFPAYILFLPTFMIWFPAYAFSRTSDLSWGNRPSEVTDGRGDTDTFGEMDIVDLNDTMHIIIDAKLEFKQRQAQAVEKKTRAMNCMGTMNFIFLNGLNFGTSSVLYLFADDERVIFALTLSLLGFSMLFILLSLVFYTIYIPVTKLISCCKRMKW